MAMPNDEVQTAMKQLENLIDDEHNMVTVLIFESMKGSMDGKEHFIHHRLNLFLLGPANSQCTDVENSIDREIRDLEEWLSPHYFEVPQHVIDKLTPGTGTWMFNEVDFEAWVRGEVRVLFCPGSRRNNLFAYRIVF